MSGNSVCKILKKKKKKIKKVLYEDIKSEYWKFARNFFFNPFHATGPFYTPWKYQKPSGFLFSGGRERDQ